MHGLTSCGRPYSGEDYKGTNKTPPLLQQWLKGEKCVPVCVQDVAVAHNQGSEICENKGHRKTTKSPDDEKYLT